MKKICVVMSLIFLSACSSMDRRPELQEKMGSNPGIQYADARTVEEIRQLRPQAEFPLEIAVMPPPGRWGGLSRQERTIIEGWGKSLKEMGFADKLTIVPSSLIPECGYQADSDCYLTRSRQAGARLGADAILFLSESMDTDAYVNPLSILNLTIVGMWFAPAHHRDTYLILEGSLFDINNGYLYAIADGYGEEKTVRPLMYAKYSVGRERARIMALNDLGTKLVSLAREQLDEATPAAGEN